MVVLVAVDCFAKVHCRLLMGMFANALHLLAFEHPIKLLLHEQHLEELGVGLNCLGLELFAHK